MQAFSGLIFPVSWMSFTKSGYANAPRPTPTSEIAPRFIFAAPHSKNKCCSHEYPLPTPYTSLYTAKADKNGEVWAGELNGGHYLRFDPKTEQFTAYTLPEPYAMDRESWIDNSTSPVSVWFVDHDGWLVHIQPLD